MRVCWGINVECGDDRRHAYHSTAATPGVEVATLCGSTIRPLDWSYVPDDRKWQGACRDCNYAVLVPINGVKAARHIVHHMSGTTPCNC